jgi:hypothetical protein
VHLYMWLLGKDVTPYLGGVPLGKLDVAGAARAASSWLWAVLVAAALVVACAVPVGLWVVAATVRASEGRTTPLVAVYGVMWQMDPWSEEDLIGAGRFLSSDHFEELRQRFIDIRDTFMARGNFVELELTNGAESIDGSSATVTMDVAAVYAADRGLTMHGNSHRWTFDVVLARGLSRGWKIDAFEAQPAVRYVSAVLALKNRGLRRVSWIEGAGA